VLLPLRIVFGLLFLPLLLVIKLIVGTVLFFVVGPIVLLATLVSIVAAVIGLIVPLLPLVFIGFVVWLLVRASRPAVA
jgi:hypothetical protein